MKHSNIDMHLHQQQKTCNLTDCMLNKLYFFYIILNNSNCAAKIAVVIPTIVTSLIVMENIQNW